jgi:(p)ppGpp synthase/HD superfamily hydrolase
MINLITEKTTEALVLARRIHSGQKRKNGERYIKHPMKVADTIAKIYDGEAIEEMICIALLHDTVEDCSEDVETLKKEILDTFGQSVLDGVLALTNDKNIAKEQKGIYLAEKMSNLSDELLLIKLCDRYCNLSDLLSVVLVDDNNIHLEFAKRYTTETLYILEVLRSRKKLDNVKAIGLELNCMILCNHICLKINANKGVIIC